jgi:uncharacterized protein YcgL (UPF0745 family)
VKYEDLKQEIKEITSIAESVPEAFREKCFELLLNKVLARETRHKPDEVEKGKLKHEESELDRAGHGPSTLSLQGQVKAFMRRRDITPEQMETLLMIENGEVHFLKEPSHGEAKRGQNEWALLLALKSGLLNNILKADPEDVRSIVQEKGFYNATNFATNFKGDRYSGYFKEPLRTQGTAQPLTPEGEKALAELIKTLTA